MNGLEIFEYWMKHTQLYLKKIQGKKFPLLTDKESDLIQRSCLLYREDLFNKA